MKILVADDETDTASAIRAHLEAMGHSVSVVSNGREAIELLRQETFDRAYIDVMMPYVDGFEVLNWIRNESAQRGLWVAVMTAHCEHVGEEELKKWRVDGCVQKPIDLAKVIF